MICSRLDLSSMRAATSIPRSAISWASPMIRPMSMPRRTCSSIKTSTIPTNILCRQPSMNLSCKKSRKKNKEKKKTAKPKRTWKSLSRKLIIRGIHNLSKWFKVLNRSMIKSFHQTPRSSQKRLRRLERRPKNLKKLRTRRKSKRIWRIRPNKKKKKRNKP